MKQFNIKKIALAIGLSAITSIAFAQLNTERSVLKNNGIDRIKATANFATPVRGDLYLATEVAGQLLFIANGGQEMSGFPTPYSENNEYFGQLMLFDFSTAGVPQGRYPLYQVITPSGADPLNFNNWIGGLGGLSVINFNIGLPVEINGDFNNDGFADDDFNRDGFYDDDFDRNGFHDDDFDENGFRDNDFNQNGFRDGDSGGSGFSGDSGDSGFSGDSGDSGFSGDSGDSGGNPIIIPPPTTSPDGNGAIQGKTDYLSCASSACHGSDPRRGQNGILKGRDFNQTLRAIQNNKGGMGFLTNIITTEAAQNIADYLNSL